MKKMFKFFALALLFITSAFSLVGCENPNCKIVLQMADGQTDYELFGSIEGDAWFTSDSCYVVKSGETKLFQVLFTYYDADPSETDIYVYQETVNYVDILSASYLLDDQNRIYYPNMTADYNIYQVCGPSETLLTVVNVELGNDEYMHNGSYRLDVNSESEITLKVTAK